ncbi:MAG: UDP-N-acetylmuramate dehydrogenase [Bacteroidota bacterium]
MVTLLEHIPLKDYTTIHLGGTAKYFLSCASDHDVKEALQYAASKGIRVHILGGGSNTIFSDEGFNGLILKNDLRGISYVNDGDHILASAKAGENWESFVRSSVEKGYAGVECLSGIPGSIGATPIQNVGAYGQEVKDTIVLVKVIERASLKEREFRNADCGFSYRTSRFKTQDVGKYIVTEVTFRLKKNGRPTIHYPEVKKIIESSVNLPALSDGKESLEAVRNVVLSLRKKKSMVIDPTDSNTRSVGSFFLNPIVEEGILLKIIETWKKIGDGSSVPTFPFENKKKIPAAWLIEKSGFKKGYKKNGVGISENHTLALVNYHGTTKALLDIAEEIRNGVQSVFGICLELEANVVS